MRILLKIALPLFLLFIFPRLALAVSVLVTDIPSSVSTDPFPLQISITGANPGTNYLRIDFYKEGTTNYFGETYNGSSWYGGSDGSLYFQIEIGESTASATLQARIGGPSLLEYPGPGYYKIKVRRYTSQSVYTFSDPYDIQITYNPTTPTPTSTPVPTSTPTSTPTPMPTPTKAPIPKPSPKPSPTEISESIDTQEEKRSDVLGLREGLSEPSPSPLVQGASEKKFPLAAILLIVGGLIIMGGAGFTLFRKIKAEGYNNSQNEETT